MPRIKEVDAFAEFMAYGPDSFSIRDLEFAKLATSKKMFNLLGRMVEYGLQPERNGKNSAENL